VDAETDPQRRAAQSYRVLWDLQHTSTSITPSSPMTPAARANQSCRHSGSGRAVVLYRLGQDHQLGYGLGLAMGAKLAKPDKLCINVWGDAAIGFTGMDFETAVRERIPIMSILLNNFFDGDRIEGDADLDGKIPFHRHLRRLRRHGPGLRRPRRAHHEPEDIVPRSSAASPNQEGVPVLLEFITSKETEVSRRT